MLRRKTDIRFLTTNVTHLLQLADYFVLEKIKYDWYERWEEQKVETLRNIAGSGNVPKNGLIGNPGKSYFLKLAADSEGDINGIRDGEGMSYVRKSKIRCVFENQVNGLLEVRQIFPNLQNIISNHRACFDGADSDKN